MFDRCVVINLERRPQRLEGFYGRVPKDWPFASIERVPAFDGEAAKPPVWYAPGNKPRYRGAWACFSSHRGVWKQAIADGLESVLIFEDDVVFADDFTGRAQLFLQHVPRDWDQIYLGGQHLHTDRIPPTRLNDHVIIGRNVNRTHAYAVRRPMMEFLVEKLSRPWPLQKPVNHYNFDYQLGTTHVHRKAYCPTQWLCGQAAGTSDVADNVKFRTTLWWKEFPIAAPQREEVAAC